MSPDEEKEFNRVKKELADLKAEFYSNNFTTSQDFVKYSRFNTRLKVPTLASTPSTCEIGEVCVVSSTGIAYVCSAANTWTKIGVQS